MEFVKLFLICFIPLFVAVDPIGLLPVYISLTQGLSDKDRKKILWESLLTATLVALTFVMVGKAIFNFLGITVADFQIAGGLILLVLAIMDLLVAQKSKKDYTPESGIVPIGVPLIVGPAVLTTLVIQVDSHGTMVTVLALLMNLVITAIVFGQAKWILKILGENGAKAVSKVVCILLAAIAVMMIRLGLTTLISMHR